MLAITISLRAVRAVVRSHFSEGDLLWALHGAHILPRKLVTPSALSALAFKHMNDDAAVRLDDRSDERQLLPAAIAALA